MDDVEAELREQLTATLGRARFPVEDPFELVPVLPDGAATEFRASGVVIPAIELGTRYGEYQEFPYDSVEPLVDDIIEGLEAEGVI